jgi:hypothetical protein
VSQVPHLRDGLLTQEAAFREVDRVLEPCLRRQGIRSEVRSHAHIPTADPPRLGVLLGHLDQSPSTQAFTQTSCRLSTGQDHIVPRSEHRRRDDGASVAVLGGEAVEDGDDQGTLAEVVQLDVGREQVRGEDLVDGLRLSRRLEEQEGASDPGDVEVGADPAGRGEEQGSSRVSVGEPMDVGRDEVVEPATGVRTPDGNRAPASEFGERVPVVVEVSFPRFRAGTSVRTRRSGSQARPALGSVALADICL